MKGIRPLVERDIPEVVRLHHKVFGNGNGDGAAAESDSRDLDVFLRDVMCRHPWREEGTSSLVYEHEGRVVGCLGLMPRPMMLEGRPIRAIVCHNFMVEPEWRSTLAALRLARAAFILPHDLLLCDGNDASRKIWERAGGTTSFGHSLRWRRLLRPVSYFADKVAGRPVARAVRPLLRLLDEVVRRRTLVFPTVTSPREPAQDLDTHSLLQGAERLSSSCALRPTYDEAALGWLLNRLGGRRGPVKFRRRLVRDDSGRDLGWYLYFARRDGIGEVVQICAAPDAFRRVLDHLLGDALEQGVVGMAGQVDPQHMAALGAAGCHLDGGKTWLLAHSRDPRVVEAIQRGDAFLTRLECEGWIRLAHA